LFCKLVNKAYEDFWHNFFLINDTVLVQKNLSKKSVNKSF